MIRDRITPQSQQRHDEVCSLPTPCSMLATVGKLFRAQGTCQDLYFSRCSDLSPCIQRTATRVKMSPAPQQRSQSDFDCYSCKQDLGQTGAHSDAGSWGFNTGPQTSPAKAVSELSEPTPQVYHRQSRDESAWPEPRARSGFQIPWQTILRVCIDRQCKS